MTRRCTRVARPPFSSRTFARRLVVCPSLLSSFPCCAATSFSSETYFNAPSARQRGCARRRRCRCRRHRLTQHSCFLLRLFQPRAKNDLSSLLSHTTLLSFRWLYSFRSGAVSNGTPSVETLDKIQSKKMTKKKKRDKKGKGFRVFICVFFFKGRRWARRKGKKTLRLRDTKRLPILFLQELIKNSFLVNTPTKTSFFQKRDLLSRPTDRPTDVFSGDHAKGIFSFGKRERD